MSTDRAVELQAAIEEADEFASLEDAAAELMRLRDDLHHAMLDARDGCWSLACEGTARRIVSLTRALGRATPWERVQIELLESGVYQRFHDLLGVPYGPPDMDVVAGMRAKREAGVADMRAKLEAGLR